MKNLIPIISEKTTQLAGDGWFTFMADKNIVKKEAADLIEKGFKVKVVKTRSLNISGKEKRRGQRVGRTPAYKKILVKLKKGQRIDAFEIET